MTEKRFRIDDDGIVTDMLDLSMYIDNEDCCEKLNELYEENEQLKTQLQNTSDQRDEFYRGARENANRVGQLEKENKELKKQREELFIRERNTKNELRKLKKENKELNSIKCFADNNGICIFNIDEAFRRCWNDNEKLVIKNKELQERNNRQCKQLDDLYRLIEQKDWRALTDIMDDFKRNDEQLQKEWKCYE